MAIKVVKPKNADPETIDPYVYLPKPHPTKAIFKRHKYPVVAVANFLQASPIYMRHILSGQLPITKSMDVKLWEIANAVQENYDHRKRAFDEE